MNHAKTEWMLQKMNQQAAEHDNSIDQEYHYTLLIKERLAASWSDEFQGLCVTYTPADETQLSGFIPDQAALHGLLARIRDLNLTLISINRVATEKPPNLNP